MQAAQEKHTIAELIELRKNSMLAPNPEYQRGAVWDKSRQRKLIDSIMRGYPLPLIYLHHIKKGVGRFGRDDFEIIDGQQRINAISDFSDGAFTLFDPIADADIARFPAFIKDEPCAWAGLSFDKMPKDLQDFFLSTEIPVAMIETDHVNEVRDLFVRLQSGLPLNHQETRDAWPGQFTEFILKLGGKPEVARYPGHSFFTSVLGMKPNSDRGKTRQLAAQITMLFLARRKNGLVQLGDIGAEAINKFYYDHLEFDTTTGDAQSLHGVLSKLERILALGKHPKLRGHDAIHAVMLADTLAEEYPPVWGDRFANALDQFLAGLAQGKAIADAGGADEFWANYGIWTRVSSDSGSVIARRHRFYMQKMFEFMQPLAPKDPNRIYGDIERTILYYDQDKLCLECGGTVDWDDHEIHHVEEHHHGGLTSLENGALVHRACHPKGVIKTVAFAAKFASWKTQKNSLKNGMKQS